MDNKTIIEYNRIIDYICTLNTFTLEELEEKISIYLEGIGLNYNKLESVIYNIVLHLVFANRFKIEKNHFINNHNNKTIDKEDKLRLIQSIDNIGDDIYLTNNKTNKHIKLQRQLLNKKCK